MWRVIFLAYFATSALLGPAFCCCHLESIRAQWVASPADSETFRCPRCLARSATSAGPRQGAGNQWPGNQWAGDPTSPSRPDHECPCRQRDSGRFAVLQEHSKSTTAESVWAELTPMEFFPVRTMAVVSLPARANGRAFAGETGRVILRELQRFRC